MYFAAQALSRKLKENLDLSLSGDAYSESLDANGYPMLKLVVNSEAFFAKIEPIEPSGMVDGLGLPQRQYSPHKITLILDPAATGKAVHYKFIAKATALGMKVSIYEGAVLALADYASALAAALRSLRASRNSRCSRVITCSSTRAALPMRSRI